MSEQADVLHELLRKYEKRLHAGGTGIISVKKKGRTAPEAVRKGLATEEGNAFILNEDSVQEAYRMLGLASPAFPAEMLAADLERIIGEIPDGDLKEYLAGHLSACRESKRIDYRYFRSDETENADALEAIAYLAKHEEGMTKRVLSVRLYNDSKHFERETEQNMLRILRGLHKDMDDESILRCHGIISYPEVIEFTGPVTIILADGRRISYEGLDHGAYINSDTVNAISAVETKARRVISAENKSNYMECVRKRSDDEIAIFTSGSFSKARSRFFSFFSALPWLHWGDIDIGGMRIFLRLRRIAGRAKPWKMDAMTLLDNKEKGMPLDDGYREELEKLLEDDDWAIFHETILMMLDTNVRLEQEALIGI